VGAVGAALIGGDDVLEAVADAEFARIAVTWVLTVASLR